MGVLTTGVALSLHLGLSGDYNEVHPFVEYNNNNIHAGIYLNSESNLSPYVNYRFENDSNYFVDVGIVGGYEFLKVAPLIRVGKNFNDNVSLFVVPSYEEHNDEINAGAVVGLQFSF